MQLRERLFKKQELMNNENAIFEISKLKYKNGELPIPIYAKASRIILYSFKTLLIESEKPNLCYKIRRVFKTKIIDVKKMLVCIFWIYMAQKFQTIEMPSWLVDRMRESLNYHYLQFFMVVNQQSAKIRDCIINK